MYPMSTEAYNASITPASERVFSQTSDRLFEEGVEFHEALHRATVTEQAYILAEQFEITTEEMINFLRGAGFMVLTTADLMSFPPEDPEEIEDENS